MRIVLGIFDDGTANLRPRSKFIILIGILSSKIFLGVENDCTRKEKRARDLYCFKRFCRELN